MLSAITAGAAPPWGHAQWDEGHTNLQHVCLWWGEVVADVCTACGHNSSSSSQHAASCAGNSAVQACSCSRSRAHTVSLSPTCVTAGVHQGTW